MPTAGVKGNNSATAIIGAIKGICLDCMTGPTFSTLGQHLNFAVTKSVSQGTPSAPSLAIAGPTLWQFRWQIRVGTQTIRCAVLQASNTTPRPTMTIKANPDVGLNADVVGTAPGGTTWVTIGPLSVTASAVGVVLVQLSNNKVDSYDTAYFDLIVAT